MRFIGSENAEEFDTRLDGVSSAGLERKERPVRDWEKRRARGSQLSFTR